MVEKLTLTLVIMNVSLTLLFTVTTTLQQERYTNTSSTKRDVEITWERQFKVSNYVHLSLIGICISLDNIYPKLQLGKNALKLVKKILKKWPITIENK